MSRGLAAHASARNGLVAQNIANADTPGYRAVDLASFASLLTGSDDSFAIKSTRPQHLARAEDVAEFRSIQQPTTNADKPNGNNVSLEEQMIKSIEVRSEHDLALGIYRKSLAILHLAIGRR